jgi:hypothetical protein
MGPSPPAGALGCSLGAAVDRDRALERDMMNTSTKAIVNEKRRFLFRMVFSFFE